MRSSVCRPPAALTRAYLQRPCRNRGHSWSWESGWPGWACCADGAGFSCKRRRSGRGGSADRSPGRGQGGFVVGVLADFLHVLHIADHVVLVDDENGPAQDAQILDEGAVGLSEGSLAVIGNHLYVIDPEG